jgi:hypothetical protein
MEIRIWLPDTLAGWRYCIKNPRSFIIGRYSYAKFIKQRDIMMAAQRRANRAEEKLAHANAKLIAARKELSALKRKDPPKRA